MLNQKEADYGVTVCFSSKAHLLLSIFMVSMWSTLPWACLNDSSVFICIMIILSPELILMCAQSIPDKAIKTLNKIIPWLFLHHFNRSSPLVPLHHNWLYFPPRGQVSTYLGAFQLADRTVHNQALVFPIVFPQILLSGFSFKLLHASYQESSVPWATLHPTRVYSPFSVLLVLTLSLLSCLCVLLDAPGSHTTHSSSVGSWEQASQLRRPTGLSPQLCVMPGTQLAFLIIISMNVWVHIDVTVVCLQKNPSCSPSLHSHI